MGPVSDEMSAFAFRMWRREQGDAEWVIAPRMSVRVNDGDPVVPAQLSWATRDGVRSTLGFAPGLASCYGHRQDSDGRVVELRGELDDRAAPDTAEAWEYEFDTETTDLDGRDVNGRLRILIDDGDGTGLAAAEWSSGSGAACAITLFSHDIGDLVSGVLASAEHRDADEVAANLLHTSTDKWFAPRSRATLEFRLTAPIAIDQYVLTSANDAPDRDPSAWTLRGSMDGKRWRTLDIRSGRTFTARHQPHTYRIAAPTPCTRYRLDITANHGSPHLQLETIQFLTRHGFAGFRHPTGVAPTPYRGTAITRATPDTPQPTTTPTLPDVPPTQLPSNAIAGLPGRTTPLAGRAVAARPSIAPTPPVSTAPTKSAAAPTDKSTAARPSNSVASDDSSAPTLPDGTAPSIADDTTPAPDGNTTATRSSHTATPTNSGVTPTTVVAESYSGDAARQTDHTAAPPPPATTTSTDSHATPTSDAADTTSDDTATQADHTAGASPGTTATANDSTTTPISIAAQSISNEKAALADYTAPALPDHTAAASPSGSATPNDSTATPISGAAAIVSDGAVKLPDYTAPTAARAAMPFGAVEARQEGVAGRQVRRALTPMVAAEFRPAKAAGVSAAVPARRARAAVPREAREVVGDESARWQHGGAWLPLGGSLAMQSLTSPSGRFTALHSPYEPSFAVRDNLTRERVWVSDSPRSSLICLGPDGDLVAWDHRGNHVWSTGTAWLGVRRLELRDSGELALIDAEGEALWSSGVPDVPASRKPGPPPRGSTLRRGERLCGQSLTSADGSTVLFHDGRVVRIIVHGQTSHWDVFPDTENVLILDEDGLLRLRDLKGGVLQQISGPGVELVVERGGAELRDEAGALVWASSPRSQHPAPIRQPGLAQDDALVAWFTTLIGDRHAVAVARDTTPEEALGKLGVIPGLGTWSELHRHRDAMNPADGTVVAALAMGPHVLLMADDPQLRVARSAAWVATVRQPGTGCDFAEFTVQQDGEVVTELRELPRRRRGTGRPEVATALTELVHSLHLHTLLFRTADIVPDATELGGELLGGVLMPQASSTPTTAPLLAIEGWESMTPLVIRTDFTDDAAWNRMLEQMREPWFDNDPVDPHQITDPRLAGAPAEQVLREVCEALPQPETPGAIFIADAITMREPGHPLLAVTTDWDGLPFEADDEEFITQFRLFPDAAIEISTNLDLANMDFEDFACEGVYERMA